MKNFKCINCGECCSPVPVSEQEIKRIREKISRMPKDKILRLKHQNRPLLTCVFRDMEKNRCGIYDVRPEICRMFGSYKGMVCPNNPEHATIDHKEGSEKLVKNGEPVGILGIHFIWNNILK
jgi:hypothetical protein